MSGKQDVSESLSVCPTNSRALLPQFPHTIPQDCCSLVLACPGLPHCPPPRARWPHPSLTVEFVCACGFCSLSVPALNIIILGLPCLFSPSSLKGLSLQREMQPGPIPCALAEMPGQWCGPHNDSLTLVCDFTTWGYCWGCCSPGCGEICPAELTSTAWVLFHCISNVILGFPNSCNLFSVLVTWALQNLACPLPIIFSAPTKEVLSFLLASQVCVN